MILRCFCPSDCVFVCDLEKFKALSYKFAYEVGCDHAVPNFNASALRAKYPQSNFIPLIFFNQYLSRGIKFSRAKWSPDTTQTQRH